MRNSHAVALCSYFGTQGDKRQYLSDDSPLQEFLEPDTQSRPSSVSQTQLINLYVFLDNLLISNLSLESNLGFDDYSLEFLRNTHFSFFRLLIPKPLRTDPEVLNLFVELKRQMLLFAMEMEPGNTDVDALFSIEPEEVDMMLAFHEDAPRAVERLKKDCQVAREEVSFLAEVAALPTDYF